MTISKKISIILATVLLLLPSLTMAQVYGGVIARIGTVASGTFANKPSSPQTGYIYFANDVGTAGVYIFYNGTLWLPYGGAQTLYNLNTTVNYPASTTGEVNLAALKIPGGLLSANGQIEVITLWSFTGTLGAKNFIVNHSTSSGTTGGNNFQNSSSSTAGSAQIFDAIRNNNSVSAQKGFTNTTSGSFGSSGNSIVTGTINTANDSYVNINGSLANSGDTLTLQSYSVVWRQVQ